MKRLKTTLLTLFSVAAFSLLMMFNITTTDGEFDFSLCGDSAVANSIDSEESCLDPEDEDEYYYDNTNPWDARNCNLDGEGCLTCTSTPIDPIEN